MGEMKETTELRLETLATQVLLLGKTAKSVAVDLGLSEGYVYRLISSPEFAAIKAQVRGRIVGAREEMLDQVTGDLKALAPLVVERYRNILLDSLNEAAVIKVGDSVLDRVGIARQTKSEQKVSIGLDKATIDLLHNAFLEDDKTIALDDSQWSYARELPPDAGRRIGGEDGNVTRAIGHDAAVRGAQGETPPESPQLDLFHGEGSDRVQGPRPGPAWDDGPVDSAVVPGSEGPGACPA